MKYCVYYAKFISVVTCVCLCVYVCVYVCVCVWCVVCGVCVCVCVISQFDLSITKQNYLFVRRQTLSHIPNTSMQCSNQPLRELNLMTGVNTKNNRWGKLKTQYKE